MARTTTRHTIVVQSSNKLGVTRLEAVGSAVLLPGWVVEIKSGAHKLGKVATPYRAGPPLVVLENQTPDTHSYPTDAAIDIQYASGDTVYYCQAQPGDVLNMWLAAGGTVQKGVNFLAAGTNGKVLDLGTNLASGTSNPIGIAWQDVTATGTAGARCLVRIL